MIDMPEDKCKKSVKAATEIITESIDECGGRFVSIDDEMIVWVPEGSLEHSPHSPETPEEREEAIEACMAGEWSREWAEAVVGPGAPEEVMKRTRRKLCEGLYD